MPFTVGTAIAARMSAGIRVQMISIVVLPWICEGSGSSGRPAEPEDRVEQRPLHQDEHAERPVERLVLDVVADAGEVGERQQGRLGVSLRAAAREGERRARRARAAPARRRAAVVLGCIPFASCGQGSTQTTE